jgi:hypothetical protein
LDAIRFQIDRTRRRGGRPRTLARAGPALLFSLLLGAGTVPAPACAGRPPLEDAPAAWEEDDRRSIPLPKERAPNLLRDGVDESFFRPMGRFFHPGRAVRRVGTWFGGDHVPPAASVNALDEVPNSSWFTNRIGLFTLTPEEAARGSVRYEGPDRDGPWTVIRAKTEGVTPGFSIRDRRGDVYVVKFDPPCCPGMSTGAGVVAGRILHAAGYNVPEDFVATFRREDLVLGENVTITDPDGTKRGMTVADIDGILARVEPTADGAWRAIASRFLKGKPVGPFDWQGRRRDDRQDRVRHENRRELRGFRVFAAWLGHFDTKQHNTLDMYVEEEGRHFLRHHFIDFASTLGAGATGPFPAGNYEYAVDFPASLGRALALGFHEDDWRGVRRPEGLEEVGFFESEQFDPIEWKPLDPNAAFANLTDRDGYWAAKIISAFTDEHLEALVAEGKYRNPEAARWIARVLGERRDKIARYWFRRATPLDFFVHDRGTLRFRDLGVDRGIYLEDSSAYRFRVAASSADRRLGGWTGWMEAARPELDLAAAAASEALTDDAAGRHPFLAIDVSVSRAGAWNPPVRVYLARASGRVVEVER